jgi:glycosyltransferase involved in cell wall biosynthesis
MLRYLFSLLVKLSQNNDLTDSGSRSTRDCSRVLPKMWGRVVITVRKETSEWFNKRIYFHSVIVIFLFLQLQSSNFKGLVISISLVIGISTNFHVKLSQNGEWSRFVISNILHFYYDSRAQIFDISHCQIGEFIASQAHHITLRTYLTFVARSLWFMSIIIHISCSRWIEHKWCKWHTFGINFHMSCHMNIWCIWTGQVICTTDVHSNVNRYYTIKPYTFRDFGGIRSDIVCRHLLQFSGS